MTHPYLVVSSDDMNAVLQRVIIVPITSKGQLLGCCLEVLVGGKTGRVLFDQTRLTGKLGEIDAVQWRLG